MCEAPASRDGYLVTFCEVYIIIVGHCCKVFTVVDRSKNVLYLMCFKAYSTAEKGIWSLFVCASYKLLVCMVRPVFVLRYEKLVQLSAFHSIAAFLFHFQSFRRLLLNKCQDEFENRSKATEGNILVNSSLCGKDVGSFCKICWLQLWEAKPGLVNVICTVL